MNVGSSVGGGGVSGYQYDMSNASEVQVTIAGGLAEVDRGGPAFNMIPKTGGNTFSGFYFGSLAGEWAQGSNIDDELRSFGFADLAGADPELGHELRVQRADPPRPHLVLQQRAHDRHLPGRPEPVRQPERRRSERLDLREGRKREGAQRQLEEDRRDAPHVAGVAARQARVLRRLHQELLGLVGDARRRAVPRSPATAGRPRVQASAPASHHSPESGTIWDAPAKIMQATYSAPLSSRILVEAGFSSFWTEWGDIRPAGAAVDRSR